MPKNLFIDPEHAFDSGKIKIKSIPVCQYNYSLEDEKKIYDKKDLLRIYRDMSIIREFETMLHEIKIKSVYNGVGFSYPGPLHLCIGEEAAAVGEAWCLDEKDFIFGSHRNHGEVLAKGLSAIEKLSEFELISIMKHYMGGKIWKIVNPSGDTKGNIREMALNFLLYGTLAEILGKSTGFNQGLGGSMHVFFPPFGSYPNNAIVGGSAGLALGAALYKKINDEKGIVIANIGDGATATGIVNEALHMSSMDQIRELWNKNGALPMMFVVMNNQYAMGGQTVGETMGWKSAARLGAGINPDRMHAEKVNGNDPLAVIDAFTRKKDVLVRGEGPVLLELLTYRTCNHSASDAESYRTPEEIDAWEAVDPIKMFRNKIVRNHIVSELEIETMRDTIVRRMTKICKMVADEKLSPRMKPEMVEALMFSNKNLPANTDRAPEVLMEKKDCPRVIEIAGKSRTKTDENGKSVPKMKRYNYADALFEPIFDKFYEDPTFVAYGEENRDWGGAFGVYRKMTEALPYHRFFNAPVAESAIVSSAIGYVMCGGHAVVDLMFADFIGRAGDEIINQLAKWQAMSGGLLKMPLVLRVATGYKYGAQHSQDLTALVSHIPGLKVIVPATPYDAKGLMTAALNSSDPVICVESQRLYDMGEEFREEGVPAEAYELPIGEPDVKKEGEDVTILTIGAALYRAMDAARTLSEKYGVSAEVIDARSIVPFHYEKVLESLAKTGKIVIVGDGTERGSVMRDMASTIAEIAFDSLDAPPVVVGARNHIVPPHELCRDFFPSEQMILDAIHQKLIPLSGHTPKHDFSSAERLRRASRGV
ncbi:MAG: dehydrogenase [Clostridia bacterium]|nr:dehydrogenase [Clostridia bacterium]